MWCLFTLTTFANAQNSFKLTDLTGIIVIFESAAGVTQPLLDLNQEYITYVVNELENKIGHQYDTLFVGFSIQFVNLDAIYYKVGSYLGLKDISQDDDAVILQGLQQLLTDYRKSELEALGVNITISLDSPVSIYDSAKII
ncbi:hypothetical protein CANTEDRAFT_113685 [Yamadazyma tenuis ATCC 10573]|nr:uncharacterized protein CANTEDRAFT_113685 [Yamadazyma tenuis ATCC 10573]EGV65182.1 hypothetical protein CANTEDRAFT_113685 [Yamadazyma tenuis ATCC 10573]